MLHQQKGEEEPELYTLGQNNMVEINALRLQAHSLAYVEQSLVFIPLNRTSAGGLASTEKTDMSSLLRTPPFVCTFEGNHRERIWDMGALNDVSCLRPK